MDTDVQSKIDKEDNPLKRADVELLLQKAGSSFNLNLSDLNLNGIDLANFNLEGVNLQGASLRGAFLEGANLQGANLEGANLEGAFLEGVNLQGANLEGADLERANLQFTNLEGASLRGANLRGANLQGAFLEGANLKDTNLQGAFLEEADLEGTILRGAILRGAILKDTSLQGADLEGADLEGASLIKASLQGANLQGASLKDANLQGANLQGTDLKRANLQGTSLQEVTGLDVESEEAEDSASTLRIRIIEEPLTAQNFTTIISSFTELHTKCWLIVQERFADLIEYTQTRNSRFAEEADLVIAKLTHNSAAEIKLDVGLKGIAEALKTGIDALVQAPFRHEAAKLDNEAEQKAILESEHQRVILAFETASKIVERLAPNADMTIKAMLIQSLLPQLLQLGSGKGLELVS